MPPLTMRERVIDAAVTLTTEDGWAQVTMARLADVVGVSRQTVYNEVGSKPAELAALLIRVYRSLDALVGNSEAHRQLWMTSFNRALNATPKDAIQTAEGLVRVVTYLDAARAPA